MPGNPNVPENRTHCVQVLLNVAERDEVQRAAEQNAMSVSTYAHSRMLAAMRRERRLEQQIERRLGLPEELAGA